MADTSIGSNEEVNRRQKYSNFKGTGVIMLNITIQFNSINDIRRLMQIFCTETILSLYGLTRCYLLEYCFELKSKLYVCYTSIIKFYVLYVSKRKKKSVTNQLSRCGN